MVSGYHLANMHILFFIKQDFFLIYVYVSLCKYMQVLREARRGHQIPWSWSLRQLRTTSCECWEPKSNPKEPQMLLPAKPSAQPPYMHVLNSRHGCFRTHSREKNGFWKEKYCNFIFLTIYIVYIIMHAHTFIYNVKFNSLLGSQSDSMELDHGSNT